MAREFRRTDRVGDQIRKDLAELIQFEVKDPRLGMVTLNEVRVSKDLGYADIYFTALGDLDGDPEEQARAAAEVLNHASGFLRTELSHRIRLRVMPQLRFHYDHSVAQGRAMSELIERARGEDRKLGSDGSSEER